MNPKLREKLKNRVPSIERLTLSDAATIYACCGLFDLCSDTDLMSLSFEGMSPFLDWLGWRPSVLCNIVKNFIAWVKPEEYQNSCTPGWLSDPCHDAYSVQFGTCDFTLHDWGRLRRAGPVRDITYKGVKLCEAQPRYRWDGTPIVDDMEFDMRMAMEVLLNDLKGLVVDGNHATPGQFDGLANLVKTGYTNSNGVPCSLMDSTVIDWNGNAMSGGAGITWNGNPIAATYDFIDVLLAIYRRIRQRIKWSPEMAAQRMQEGDMVLTLPSDFIQCVLDMYTCWSVCPGQAFNEANLNTFEARRFRDQLLGGLFGDGQITLDGFPIPLVGYDWGSMVQGPTRFDAYLLTGSIGAIKVINGEFLDMRTVPPAVAPGAYQVTDGGRVLTWETPDNTCVQRSVEMRPRLLMWAPWAQARIHDVRCNTPGGIIVPDPCDSSFFPMSSFSAAACP